MRTTEEREAWVLDGGVALKATPGLEAGLRVLWIEPSNEEVDIEQERVLQQALLASAEHYLKHGNVDIEHLTIYGWRYPHLVRAAGYSSPRELEIGRPVEVREHDGRVLVKARIYSGPTAKAANWFWSTITEFDPPMLWYPSIGGTRPVRECRPDGVCDVVGLEWTNIGLSQLPKNRHVPPVSTVSPDEFLKAVTAGFGTDTAQLTGGGALRRESLEGVPIRAHQYELAAARLLRRFAQGGCRHTRGDSVRRAADKGAQGLLELFRRHFIECESQDDETARQWAERLAKDLDARVRRAGGGEA